MHQVREDGTGDPVRIAPDEKTEQEKRASDMCVSRSSAWRGDGASLDGAWALKRACLLLCEALVDGVANTKPQGCCCCVTRVRARWHEAHIRFNFYGTHSRHEIELCQPCPTTPQLRPASSPLALNAAPTSSQVGTAFHVPDVHEYLARLVHLERDIPRQSGKR